MTTLTPDQLRTEVTCVFPPGGGRIEKAGPREQTYDEGVVYMAYDRSGNQRHKFVVQPGGTVMEAVRRDATGSEGSDSEHNGDYTQDQKIQLGLGDFIFYSVLVSKAAQYSFTTFAACLLVVLSGLSATLVILAISGKALPALPISIFLGVAMFLLTRTFIHPWVFDFLPHSIYV